MQIRAENLVKIYRGRRVVDGVSFHVKKGEVVGLLGPNGAGKTTSFYMIVGMIKANEGKVFINDVDVSNKPMHKRARMRIAYLPQEPSVFRKLSVQDNIMAVLQTTGLNREKRKHRLESLMEEFKISHLRKSKAFSLSGGERRRLEIARALTTDPAFLLLDEPFAGIDPIAVEEIQSMISALRDKGIGILITDHNVRETLAITKRAYIMFEGKVLVEGSAKHLADDPEARRIYLGQSFSLT
ncbi:MAG: LPS export ABC transporter ATP-binding protein [Fibrobacteria bacterium]|nr:LPS export ABC transporter ATP-binding protein [Fibrobacteria bacterium]